MASAFTKVYFFFQTLTFYFFIALLSRVGTPVHIFSSFKRKAFNISISKYDNYYRFFYKFIS